MTTKTKILIGILGMVIIAIIILIVLLLPSSIFYGPGVSPDAKAMSAMAQIQVIAELVKTEEKSYNNLSCNYDDRIRTLCEEVKEQIEMEPVIQKTEDQYCTYIKLKKGWFYCIDSKGFKKEIDVDPSNFGCCDGITFVCQRVEDETADWRDFKNTEVIIKENEADKSKTDIFIKNLNTNEEKFYITLSNIYVEHYHGSEFHNGNLYIIRRIGYEGYPDEDWTDELWRYDRQGEGTKIYSNQGIDFCVAPNEKYIALLLSDEKTTGERLAFTDSQNKIIKEFTVDQLPNDGLGDMINIFKWADDSSEIWGSISSAYVQDTFLKIKIPSCEVTGYSVNSKLPEFAHREYNINPNTGKIVYSDYPVFFEVEERQQWEAKKEKFTLFFYDLNTDQKEIITTSITKSFQPEWLNDNTIEYNNPSNNDRIIYNIE